MGWPRRPDGLRGTYSMTTSPLRAEDALATFLTSVVRWSPLACRAGGVVKVMQPHVATRAAQSLGSVESGVSKLAGWMAENLTPTITLLAVLAYGALRLMAVAFYRHFGVSPEDVGYDYTTVLAAGLPGFAAFALIPMAGGGLYFAVRHRRRAQQSQLALVYTVILPLYLVVSLMVLCASIQAGFGRLAEAGHRVDGFTMLGVQLLPWRVEPSTLTPASSTGVSTLAGLSKHCFMYLGQSQASYVLYDVSTREPQRVPIDAVNLEIGRFPSGCTKRRTS
jgi:hypothetical protein